MNEMNENQTKIYNNIIQYLKTFEFEDGTIRWWVIGYLGGMIDIGKITGIEACRINCKVEKTIQEIIEKKHK